MMVQDWPHGCAKTSEYEGRALLIAKRQLFAV